VNPIRCFLLEPTDQAEVSFRRYSHARCPGPHGHHNASNVVGCDPYPIDNGLEGDGLTTRSIDFGPDWPTRCSCGYAFLSCDQWQVNRLRLYRRADTRAVHTLVGAPVGAMWFADWYGEQTRGPDGHCLVVKTPAGDWLVDGKSSSGGRWTRQGTAPLVTANPSIGFPDGKGGWLFHAFLRNGVLEPC
jgi:hypothetical protein